MDPKEIKGLLKEAKDATVNKDFVKAMKLSKVKWHSYSCRLCLYSNGVTALGFRVVCCGGL